MKKMIFGMLVVVAFASSVFAADSTPSIEKINAAKADWAARYEPIMNGPEPTGNDADRPGISVSWQRADGVIEQYGTSLTPREYWQMVRAGGGSE